MKKASRYISLIILLSTCVTINAQLFVSDNVGNIYNRLVSSQNGVIPDSICLMPIDITQKENTVYDVGVNIPNLNIDDKIIESFIERKTLELILAKSREEIYYALDRSNTKLIFNDADYKVGPFWNLYDGIDVLRKSTKLSYTSKNNNFYLIAEYENNKFGIMFPNNIQTITDKDKKELEQELEAYLTSEYKNPNLKQDTSDLKKDSNDIYVSNTDFLHIKTMNNATYYQLDSLGNFNLIYSPNYAIESFTNMFHHISTNSQDVELQIKQYMYGNIKKEYTITLEKLNSYCKANSLKIYVGIENQEENKIEGSIILLNDKLNFIHLLHVRSNVATLFNASGGKMAVKLYAYIPTDNIKNMYADEKTNK